MGHGQKVVDDFETRAFIGVIDAADIHQLMEPAVRIVAQGFQHRDDGVPPDGDHQFAKTHLVGQQLVAKLVAEVFGKFLEGLIHGLLGSFSDRSRFVRSRQRHRAPVRRIFFCNWRMPYTSASAVGGQPGT
mgnify:CR=1 FL=1